jgi:hypothetical protein
MSLSSAAPPALGTAAAGAANVAARADHVHPTTGLLPLSGGTMTGAINMGSQKITALGTPSPGTTDASTMAYVDSRIWFGTQAQYDAIPTKDPTVLYCISV